MTIFYKNIHLKNLKDDMIIKNSLIEHNKKPTFLDQELYLVSITLFQIAQLKYHVLQHIVIMKMIPILIS